LKARIFYLKSQQKLRRDIASSLRRIFYADIEIEDLIYDDENEAQIKRVGRSYLELMRASTASVDSSFNIVEEYEERGYYWYTDGKYMLRLPRNLKTRVFPAVAIMDRMVMVPREIHQAFEVPTDFAYIFRPLDMHGVVLADFADRQTIDNAMLRVAAQIRKEIVSIARRHMSSQGMRGPDLEELSRLLDLETEFLEELTEEIIGPSHHLVTEVTSKPLRLKQDSRVTLSIRNESADPLGTVRVQIRAPSAVMEAPLVEYLDFSSGKTKHRTIEFVVQPQATPFCPLEVLFILENASDDPLPPVALILDVTEN
jgi:hypothetical protein